MDNVFHATAADVEFAHEVTLSPALRVQAAYLDYYFFRDGHLVCTGFGGMSCVMVTVRWFKVVQAIIRLIQVFVVKFRRHPAVEGMEYDTMDFDLAFRLPERDTDIALLCGTQRHNTGFDWDNKPVPIAHDTWQASDTTLVRHFVKTFPSRDWTPFFHPTNIARVTA